LLRIKSAFWFSLFLLPAHLLPVTLEGRLPGEFFREDNPPRFGAVMSFHSSSDSLVVLHAVNNGEKFTVAQQLTKIAKGFKVPAKSLEKLGMIEGSLRWLQYAFHKKDGGGFIYITRSENTIIYLVIFNLKYDALARDLPYIDRYVKMLHVQH
jgi:hypothetical protein